MDNPAEIERVLITVNEFLGALDSRSWAAFDACFARSATVFLSETPDDAGGVFAWREIRPGWRHVFSAEQSRAGPLDPARRRPIVEVHDTTAYVSFTGARRADDQAMVMKLIEGRWLIRRLNVERLPLRPVAPAATVAASQTSSRKPDSAPQGWFVPVLVASLISIALLGTLSDRRSATQLAAAVLAVFFGAVTILRGELGTWFHGGKFPGTPAREVPLTGSGALVVAVGAAFLVT